MSILRRLTFGIVMILSATIGTAVPAIAANTSGPNSDFAVTVAGKTYNEASGKEARVPTTATGLVQVTGKNVTFSVDIDTLTVNNYALTGALVDGRMVTAPTVLFASKAPLLTTAQLNNAVLTEARVRDGDVTLYLQSAAGKFKIQAKDAPQGGIFQMEQEFGVPVDFKHTLGAGLFYFKNAYTGKINFGDGKDGVANTGSNSDWHQMLLGKDSPQVATKLSQTATTSTWRVESGGRMGGVLGEDSIELSQGATNCTSQCQAEN